MSEAQLAELVAAEGKEATGLSGDGRVLVSTGDVDDEIPFNPELAGCVFGKLRLAESEDGPRGGDLRLSSSSSLGGHVAAVFLVEELLMVFHEVVVVGLFMMLEAVAAAGNGPSFSRQL